MSAAGVPQLAVVLGSCTAGGAVCRSLDLISLHFILISCKHLAHSALFLISPSLFQLNPNPVGCVHDNFDLILKFVPNNLKYVPAMSDESVIVHRNGTIFLAGPPLVKAATQEVVSAEELGGADVHTGISGVADHFAPDEPSALAKVRQIVGALPADPLLQSCLPKNSSSFVEEPLYPLSDLLSIIPEDNRIPFDVRQILARVLDGSRFHE